MTHSIIGSGNVGSALARQFARGGIAVGIANAHGPASVQPLKSELSGYVCPRSCSDRTLSNTVGDG